MSGLNLAGGELASSGPSEAQGTPAPGLASAPHGGPLGRVQLRFLGSKNASASSKRAFDFRAPEPLSKPIVRGERFDLLGRFQSAN